MINAVALCIALCPALPVRLLPAFVANCAAHGVPLDLALAVAQQESGGRPWKVGRHGERSALQVAPSTWRRYCSDLNPRNWDAGVECGVRVLAVAWRECGPDVAAAASRYNRGSGCQVSRYGRAVAALVDAAR
jgi:soluble lytic murein transglycosylase-like protein